MSTFDVILATLGALAFTAVVMIAVRAIQNELERLKNDTWTARVVGEPFLYETMTGEEIKVVLIHARNRGDTYTLLAHLEWKYSPSWVSDEGELTSVDYNVPESRTLDRALAEEVRRFLAQHRYDEYRAAYLRAQLHGGRCSPSELKQRILDRRRRPDKTKTPTREEA